MLRNLSHDFARYVINTVRLEDIGCRLKVCGTNSTKSSSMALTELVCLFDNSTKSTIAYIFIVLLTDNRYEIV